MEKFIITKEQRDGLLAYLMTRPFQEVEAGIYWLRNLEVVAIKEKENDNDK